MTGEEIQNQLCQTLLEVIQVETQRVRQVLLQGFSAGSRPESNKRHECPCRRCLACDCAGGQRRNRPGCCLVDLRVVSILQVVEAIAVGVIQEIRLEDVLGWALSRSLVNLSAGIVLDWLRRECG